MLGACEKHRRGRWGVLLLSHTVLSHTALHSEFTQHITQLRALNKRSSCKSFYKWRLFIYCVCVNTCTPARAMGIVTFFRQEEPTLREVKQLHKGAQLLMEIGDGVRS